MTPDVILRPDARMPYGMGESLAVRDDRLLVGAPWRDYAYAEDPATEPPRACVYLREPDRQWRLHQILKAADPRTSEGFGRAVALSASFADVGAPGHEGGDGPTQSYRWNQTTYELGTAFAPPSESTYVASYEEYGVALASDDRAVVIGASIAGLPDQAGAVYVFDRATGRSVTLPHPADVASFGTAVAMAGDTLVVGASSHGTIVGRLGSVFVYQRTDAGWRMRCRLDGEVLGEGFGAAVAIDGARIVVGAPGKRDSESPGRVDVFELAGDSCKKLVSIPGGYSFGCAVALRGDRLVVGESCHTAPGGPVWTGRVALMRLAETGVATLEQWVVPREPEARLWFGHAVAIANDYVAATARALRDAASFVGISWW